MDDKSTSSQEVYEAYRDFGGPDPQIKIITSDNHAFMVSVKVLTDASLVFRAMVDTCSGTELTATLELTDEAEESYAVEGLLECMTIERDFGNITDQEHHIVELAKKYECSEILMKIELAIYREVLSRHQYGDYVFGIAATLEAWPLCGYIISDLEDWNKNRRSLPLLYGAVDPKTWSPSDTEQNAAAYGSLFVWGMYRSAMEASHPDTGMDYRRMGRIFSAIMREAKKDKTYQVDKEKLRKIAPLPEPDRGDKRRKVDTGAGGTSRV